MFFDTHCHLNIMVQKPANDFLSTEHFDDIEKIVLRARSAGVTRILNVGTSLAESLNSIAIAQHCASVWASVGIHPCDLAGDWQSDFAEIAYRARDHREHKIVAIGETGLDYYHQPYDKHRQEVAFRAHIELALQYDLPVVVHVREATDDTLRILSEYISSGLRGVNHCFVHDISYAKQLISWGFYLGIDAPITYPKNTTFRETVSRIPLENIILETDAPFLPPQSYRGKQNSPVYIPEWATTVAEVLSVDIEKLARVTTANACALFNII